MPAGSIDNVVRELKDASEKIKEYFSPSWIRKEGLSLAYAPPGALTPREVATLSEDQVTTLPDNPITRMVLTAMRFDPSIRCVAVIHYSNEILTLCESMLLEIYSFDRAREPPGIPTIDWGVAFCCERCEGVPDIIFDLGCEGKVPLIRFFGENPTMVSARLIRIVTRIINTNFKEE